MAKIILVDGPPGSGKTTFSVKLAQELHATTNKAIVYVSADTLVPSMGLLFPYQRKNKRYSLGRALDRTEILPEDLMAEMNVVSQMSNIGYLGYQADENLYTYPAPTDDKIQAMFRGLRTFADYIIVDCDRDREDLISNIARGYADHAISLVNPDIRCMDFYGSMIPDASHIKVLNIPYNDKFLPLNEITAHFKGVNHVIQYSRALREQEFTGTLVRYLNDAKYRGVMKKIAKEVT